MHTSCTSMLCILVSCSCLQAVLNTVVCIGLAQGLCNMATPRYRLQGMSDRHTRTGMHIYLLDIVFYCSHCAVALFAIYSVTAVCTGFVQHAEQPGTACSICLTGPTHQIGAHIYDRCATRAVQLHLFAAISCFCVVSGCTGFVQHAVKTNTARYSLHGMSDRNTREKACISIPLCLAALIVQLQLSASYPDYCCMHRVCAACRGSQVTACKVIQTNRTHLTRYIDVQQYTCNILGTCFVICSCLLLSAGCVAAACTGFVQHAHTARYRCRFALIGTTLVRMSRSITVVMLLKLCVAVCKLSGYCCMHRVCAACRKSGSPCKVIRPTEHIQTGTLMSESILATYEQLVLHLLAVGCNCLHRVCAACPPARYRLHGMSDCVITRTGRHTFISTCCAKVCNSNWSV
jgi:hypothetical protein